MNLPTIDCIRIVVSNWTLWNVSVSELKMETITSVWNVVESVRVASGAAEVAIFTAILYWFFTSSRVADMLELVGERVGGWCGRDPGAPTTIRQAVRSKRKFNADIYARLDQERSTRASSLYKVKQHPSVPVPQPPQLPSTGLACCRCAPKSRESWRDPKKSSQDNGAVINILDIGRQNFANGGVVSRYLCDLAQCCQLNSYDYKDIVPEVIEDESFQLAIKEATQRELQKEGKSTKSKVKNGDQGVRKRVEAKAMKVLKDISSAMSNNVLKLVAWVCHKAVRRVARGGCGTRGGSMARLSRARAAGLPLVFVPLHRSHFDYILVTFALYLCGLRPPLVAAGDNMRIPLFGWFLRGCGAFYIRRKVNGSDHNSDGVYKAALRSYILHSLSNKNNLEFFIEGGRTRTGKPQPPKAGILSVIMDAYLDGTIDDALLVPVALNYDRLVDGNFVREQLGRPKQMETFWSALRGIWRTLNTDHGGIRVDFNQPISLKELVTSFQRFNYLQEPGEASLASLTNNNLAVSLDRQILYSNSHSSLYGADVTQSHKMTVEAIGRHLVYDAAQATAIMSTNVVAYVLLQECRSKAGVKTNSVLAAIERRRTALADDGRDMPNATSARALLTHACDMLGKSLVRREGSGDKQVIKAVHSIPAYIELGYYANTIVAHYAPQAIVVTAIESILCSPDADPSVLRHSEIISQALLLSAILSQELILCPPCRRTEELLEDTMANLATSQIFNVIQVNEGLEEQRWSRRFARRLEEDSDEETLDMTSSIKYKVNLAPEAVAERRRLLLTLRPLLEAYSATCRCLAAGNQKDTETKTLDFLTEQFVQGNMRYGEAVSTDAIRNCMRMLKQWGIINLESEGRDRNVTLCHPYGDRQQYDKICQNVYKFNVNSPLLENLDRIHQ